MVTSLITPVLDKCDVPITPLAQTDTRHCIEQSVRERERERERETGGQESWEEAVGSGLSGAEHTHCYNDGTIKAKCLLTFKSLKCQQS